MLRKTLEVPLRTTRDYFIFIYLNLFERRQFLFEGVPLFYYYGLYNTTWANERTIEVPIGRFMVMKYSGKNILEVGNTLKHYFQYDGDVVDKYEDGGGVINEDVVDFKSDKKYDLIISLSTMEHVGFDEEIKDPDKIKRSLEVLKKHLTEKGKLLVTMPLGYNPNLDRKIQGGEIDFTRIIFFQRYNKNNEWEFVNQPDWENIKYGSPYPWANWIIIGIFEK